MAIDTRDKLIAGLNAGQRLSCYKASLTTEGAGTWHSLLKAAGWPSPATASPPAYTAGSGYIPDNTLLGSMRQANAGVGLTNYLLQWTHAGATLGRVILYDRVWHCSGLTTNGSNPTTLSIATPGNIDRPSDWLGLEIWGEVYGAAGATGSVWTVAYTDGVDGNQIAVYTHPANAESVGQMFPFVGANPHLGVKSIVSLTTTIASGTAGDIGITVLRRVAEFPNTIVNIGDSLDAFFLGMPTILPSACLCLMVGCSATNTGVMSGTMVIGAQ